MDEIKLGKSSLFYYLAYTLFMLTEMFTNVIFITGYVRYIKIVMVLLLFAHLVVQPKGFNKQTLWKMFLITIILVLSFIKSTVNSNLLLFFLIFCIKDIDLDRLVKYDLKLKTIFLIIIVTLYYMGFTDNYYLYRNGVRRSSMGFSHPNKFGAILFSIFCEFIYCFNQKSNLKMVAFLTIIVSSIIYYFSGSRTSVVTVILLFLIYSLCSYKDVFKYAIVKNIVVYLYVLLLVISCFLGKNYNPNKVAYRVIDDLLSTRLKSAHIFLTNYDINLFGNELDFSEAEARKNHVGLLILDNAYVRILLNFGLIYTIMLGFLYIKLMKIAIKEKNTVLCIILVIFAIRGLVENNAFSLYSNVFLLFLSKVIYDKDELDNNTYKKEQYLLNENNRKDI